MLLYDDHVQPQPVPHVADSLQLADPLARVEEADVVGAEPQQVGVAEAAPTRSGLSAETPEAGVSAETPETGVSRETPEAGVFRETLNLHDDDERIT
jgi:hypothetical protein